MGLRWGKRRLASARSPLHGDFGSSAGRSGRARSGQRALQQQLPGTRRRQGAEGQATAAAPLPSLGKGQQAQSLLPSVSGLTQTLRVDTPQAIREALGDKAGISRYGDATVPLDEALVRAVVDLSGRPYLVHTGEPAGFEYHLIGGHFTGSMIRHVFEAIAYNAGITVHVTVLDGRDPHHIAEAEFKAFARAFRKAVEFDARVEGIPSTKGAL